MKRQVWQSRSVHREFGTSVYGRHPRADDVAWTYKSGEAAPLSGPVPVLA